MILIEGFCPIGHSGSIRVKSFSLAQENLIKLTKNRKLKAKTEYFRHAPLLVFIFVEWCDWGGSLAF